MALNEPPGSPEALRALRERIDGWARELGFAAVGVSRADPGPHVDRYRRWLALGHHGTMGWMASSEALRAVPDALEPGTLRVVSVRMRYLVDEDPARPLRDPRRAAVARYAVGRDYHKLVRRRLARLAERLREAAPATGVARAFCDSAPVLEKAYAEAAGLGWIGKNTLLLTHREGSWYFLGELFTDLPLPVDPPETRDLCGRCTACLDVCPTGAFTGPRQLDARKCISYLTIEHDGVIPEALRPRIGNRIFGCDDCQLVCPWNRDAPRSTEGAFSPRPGLDGADLTDLIAWDEATFDVRSRGSPIRRLGLGRWLRNVAVALGNAPPDARALAALREALPEAPWPAPEHIRWAIERQESGLAAREARAQALIATDRARPPESGDGSRKATAQSPKRARR